MGVQFVCECMCVCLCMFDVRSLLPEMSSKDVGVYSRLYFIHSLVFFGVALLIGGDSSVHVLYGHK